MSDARTAAIELMYGAGGQLCSDVLDALLSDAGRPLLIDLLADHGEMVEYLKKRGVLVPVDWQFNGEPSGWFKVALPGGAEEQE